MNTMAHEGVAPIPIRLLAIKVIDCVAYRPKPLSKPRLCLRVLPFLQISPYLILSVLALTLTPGILGGNYFPAFPPTCPAWRTVDNEDEQSVSEKSSLVQDCHR